MFVRTINEPDMPPDLDAAIRAVLRTCFPNDAAAFSGTRAWHGSAASVSFVATNEQGEVVGHVGVHDRTVTVGSSAVRVAGVQNVCVMPGHRKTGLFDRLMTRVIAEVSGRPYDVGMLFCLPVLVRVYARFGWQELPGRRVTRVDDAGAETGLPSYDVPMFLPLAVRDLPPGDIHLNGNDW